MSIPSINFLHLTVSEIQAGQTRFREDEVTHLAPDLYFILSKYFFSFAAAKDSDCSEFGSKGFLDSNFWLNCGSKGGLTNSVSSGLFQVFCTRMSSTQVKGQVRLLARTRLPIRNGDFFLFIPKWRFDPPQLWKGVLLQI